MCVARVKLKNEYYRCEDPECKKKKHPKIYVDHIKQCGDVDEGYIKRLFCPSTGLQALCKKHHDAKTKAERALAKKIIVETVDDLCEDQFEDFNFE